ncbi:MAG: class I SAM-dependent RNA methyltransferase [Anaerolineales bacterium]|nr:class I SAM-dependent RNA methyltransferase [Anaerolineales bacterium]
MTTEILTLTSFAYGGEAFGRLADGRACFVPYALPGETVRIALVEEKRNFGRGHLLEIITAAPERIESRCRHHFRPGMAEPACGGCHYQMMPYERQLQAKTEILRDQLQRIGRLENPNIRPAVGSPELWNYRNHIQFHQDAEGKLGYIDATASGILPIHECHLPEPVLNDLWPQLELDPIPGLARVSLRAGAGEDVMLILESDDPEPVELELDLPLSVVHQGPGGNLVLAGDDRLVIEVNGRDFYVSSAAFFQVNTALAGEMVRHLLANLDISPGSTVIDAYCGVGLFSAFLAEKSGRLVGIESSESACEDFALNLDEFDNVELYEAPVEQVLPQLEIHPDLIVVDPPRAGLERAVLDAILRLAPPRLAYISCDPATLGRDARRLDAGGYRLEQVTPFDLFPQTYHIESISFWVRGAGDRG